MKISIIIPFYGKWFLVHKRLYEITNLVHEPADIILVDDASPSEGQKKAIAWWQKNCAERHVIRYIRNEENLGFGGSMNIGARVALKHDAEILIFLSNDVEAYTPWVFEIVEIIDNDKNVLVGAEVLWGDTGWNKINNTIIPYLNGWLLACHADVWKELGGFDPRYGKHDYEDLDISLAATLKGYRLVPLTRGKFHHMAAQTAPYSPEREAITLENQKKFIEKWEDKV